MGLDVLDNLLMKSKFPWMLSNVLDARTSKPLLNLKTTLTVDIGKVKVNLKFQIYSFYYYFY
jgi:2',3'-cyclic-nucleotide 2'-phosphodiesterase (5'-nucleotidase family)